MAKMVKHEINNNTFLIFLPSFLMLSTPKGGWSFYSLSFTTRTLCDQCQPQLSA